MRNTFRGKCLTLKNSDNKYTLTHAATHTHTHRRRRRNLVPRSSTQDLNDLKLSTSSEFPDSERLPKYKICLLIKRTIYFFLYPTNPQTDRTPFHIPFMFATILSPNNTLPSYRVIKRSPPLILSPLTFYT